MDMTFLFKAYVKTIKTKNRAFGHVADNDRNRILYEKPPKQEFTVKTKEVIQQITKLFEFLTEHQRSYLNFSNHLLGLPEMSDSERDKIDAGAQKVINMCSSTQVFEHQKTVVLLMEQYLKEIFKFYSELRAIRVQHSLQLKNLNRIDLNKSVKGDNQITSPDPNSNLEKIDYNNETNSLLSKENKLSTEELQIFEQENNELFNELSNLTDEVQQIERKVTKIAELQEIFSEKVLQQDKDMDLISTMIVGTTENVKDANDQIRQAIQRNAGLRVWVLFFLLVMSFSLLFLDWYND
ncbi:syntaxin-18, putative [Pediculus humanus corporis]|uniref:Syntaxin-18 n=1 Tax=Pediculus humanus subsp. corporis TaxID=121224 RepID=E0VJI0_PEDHC|nr:syntaxin-18, putative [Pediculus humanus corporis]EEB13536.1 syntaxin-18, putative [Pediculus humanus corporis]